MGMSCECDHRWWKWCDIYLRTRSTSSSLNRTLVLPRTSSGLANDCKSSASRLNFNLSMCHNPSHSHINDDISSDSKIACEKIAYACHDMCNLLYKNVLNCFAKNIAPLQRIKNAASCLLTTPTQVKHMHGGVHYTIVTAHSTVRMYIVCDRSAEALIKMNKAINRARHGRSQNGSTSGAATILEGINVCRYVNIANWY